MNWTKATPSRAQANLPVLAVALVLLTTVTGVSVALADGALVSADRTPEDRRVATVVADRLVAADAGTTRRANVLNETAVDDVDVATVESVAPPARDAAVRVRLDDRTLLERGDVTDGVTVRRVVLVANRTAVTRTVDLSDARSVTLPRRTSRVTVDVATPSNTTVQTLRANDRVVLHDDDGLADDGAMDVRTSRYETTRLTFTTSGSDGGTVTFTYYPTQTTKAVLEVTADV